MYLLQCIWERKDRETDRKDTPAKMEDKIKSFCIANQPGS